MGIKQLRERKKKERERASKAKVQKRREQLRQKNKKDKEVARLERKTRDKLTPYVDTKKKDDKIRAQLERNMEVLKRLEKEHVETTNNKKQLNESLEEAGCLTLKDKLDALEQKKNQILGLDAVLEKEEKI